MIYKQNKISAMIDLFKDILSIKLFSLAFYLPTALQSKNKKLIQFDTVPLFCTNSTYYQEKYYFK